MRRLASAAAVLAISVVAIAVAASGSSARTQTSAATRAAVLGVRREMLAPLPALPLLQPLLLSRLHPRFPRPHLLLPRLHPPVPGPTVCYVAAGRCSLTPCREFVLRASVADGAVDVFAPAAQVGVRCAPKAATVPIVAAPLLATPAR